MRVIEFREALREAMSEEMRRDEKIFLMGEEVAEYNGAYKVSKGMLAEFGEKRVIEGRVLEPVDFVVTVGAGAKMSVAINKAGQYGRVRKIDDICARGNLQARGGSHVLDALALDRNHHGLTDCVAGGVDKPASKNVGGLGWGRRFVGL